MMQPERPIEVTELCGARLESVVTRDTRATTWRAIGEDGRPCSVRVLHAETSNVAASVFQHSVNTLRYAHLAGNLRGIAPVLGSSADGRAYVMPHYGIGSAIDLPALGWDLGRVVRFFREVCRAVRALHAAGVVIGRWSVRSIALDDQLEPAIIVDLDPVGVLEWQEAEKGFFAPEVLREEPFDGRADVFVLGKVLELLVEENEPTNVRAQSTDGRHQILLEVIATATAESAEYRHVDIDALLAGLDDITEDPVSAVRRPSDRPGIPAPGRWVPPRQVARATPEKAEAPDDGRGQIATWLAAGAAFVPLSVASYLIDFPRFAIGAASLAVVAAAAVVASCARHRPIVPRIAAVLAVTSLVWVLDPLSHLAQAGAERRLHHASVAVRTEQVARLVERGVRSFPGARLPRASFDGKDLASIDLCEGDLSDATFRGANLSGAILEATRVAGADFSGANLSGVDLVRTVDWREARCDETTILTDGWRCDEGRLEKQ